MKDYVAFGMDSALIDLQEKNFDKRKK